MSFLTKQSNLKVVWIQRTKQNNYHQTFSVFQSTWVRLEFKVSEWPGDKEGESDSTGECRLESVAQGRVLLLRWSDMVLTSVFKEHLRQALFDTDLARNPPPKIKIKQKHQNRQIFLIMCLFYAILWSIKWLGLYVKSLSRTWLFQIL